MTALGGDMEPRVSFSGGINQGIQMGGNYGTINFGSNSQNEDERVRNENCLRDLQSTNPRFDKKRIEDQKGGLLKDAYKWVLEDHDFKQWRDREHSQLLWIHGNPGKGKTMLMCGIVDELSKSSESTVSYFFCGANDSRFNHDAAVLRGLIFMLVERNPLLISHVRQVYDNVGKKAFEGDYASDYLSEILDSILEDSQLRSTYLLIDALDECTDGLERLLNLIVKQSSVRPNIKWLVSSRNWQEIRELLEDACSGTKLSLELNETSVAQAVTFYIDYQVQELTKKKRYNAEMSERILQHLRSNAQGTFLWVSLVCNRLGQTAPGITPQNLDVFPPGLDKLYERMFDHINTASEDTSDLCKCLLAVVTTVFRPITLDELPSCIDLSGRLLNRNEVEGLVELCGSFLTLRERTIYLVHQSALDFLLNEAAQAIFPAGVGNVHQSICSNSLMGISKVLRRDVCDLGHPGACVDDLDVELVDNTPLVGVKYACIFWCAHLRSYFQLSGDLAKNCLRENGPIDLFFRNDYLHWIEALSMLRDLPNGIPSLLWLEGILKDVTCDSCLVDRVYDAYRFLKFHISVIQKHPLQTYTSALLFSPRKSITRESFLDRNTSELLVRGTIATDYWGPSLQDIEVPVGRRLGDFLNRICSSEKLMFSPNSEYLISASGPDCHVWDSSSGRCLFTLSDMTATGTFSPESKFFAFSQDECSLKKWDRSKGLSSQYLEDRDFRLCSPCFSPDCNYFGGVIEDFGHSILAIKIWDTRTGQCQQTIRSSWGKSSTEVGVSFQENWSFEPDSVWSNVDRGMFYKGGISFSPDSTLIAAIFRDGLHIWGTESGKVVGKIPGQFDWFTFSFDAEAIALVDQIATQIVVYDTQSLKHRFTIKGRTDKSHFVTFSHDCKLLALVLGADDVSIWDWTSGRCLQNIQDPTLDLISVSRTRTGLCGKSDDVHEITNCVTFSHDLKLVALSSPARIQVWNIMNGQLLHFVEMPALTASVPRSPHSSVLRYPVIGRNPRALWVMKESTAVTFTHDSSKIAFSSDIGIKIWDISRQYEEQPRIRGYGFRTRLIEFAKNSKFIISATNEIRRPYYDDDGEGEYMTLWDAESGHCLANFNGSNLPYEFSPDSSWLAIPSCNRDTSGIIMFKANESNMQVSMTWLDIASDYIRSMFFSGDSRYFITNSIQQTVRIWNPRTAQCIKTLDGNLEAIAVSHDSRLLAVVSHHDYLRVLILSFDESFRHIDILPIHITPRSHPIMTFSIDSNVTAYSDKNHFEIRDLKNGRYLRVRVQDDEENPRGVHYIDLIAFSSDSTLIVTFSRCSNCIEVWDASRGKCLHYLSTRLRFRDISFDDTGSYIETNLGTICLPVISDGRKRHKVPEFKGYSISEDSKWITWNSEKVLWLPADYQPPTGGFAVSGSKICIGCASGEVVILNLDPAGPFGPQISAVRASLKRRRGGSSVDEAAKRPMGGPSMPLRRRIN